MAHLMNRGNTLGPSRNREGNTILFLKQVEAYSCNAKTIFYDNLYKNLVAILFGNFVVTSAK